MTWDATKWVEAERVYVPKGPPPYPVFFNTYNGIGVTIPWNGKLFTRGAWTRVNLGDMVPDDCKAVFMTGILIITHGTNAETADLTINLKPPSSNENPLNYEGQTIEAMVGGGQRSPYASWVGVENKEFDFYWNTTQLNGNWPDWSSFGASLQIQQFAR
jgi:hypothetical protein